MDKKNVILVTHEYSEEYMLRLLKQANTTKYDRHRWTDSQTNRMKDDEVVIPMHQSLYASDTK